MKNSMQGSTLALAWSRCLGLKDIYELPSRPRTSMSRIAAIGKSGMNVDQTARRNMQPKEAIERSTLVETNGPSHLPTRCSLFSCHSPKT